MLRHAKSKTRKTSYVMHPEELLPWQGSGIPREDSENHENRVEENRGDDEYSRKCLQHQFHVGPNL